MLLTKDQILEADDLRTEDVEVPEWGGTVRVRSLVGSERDAFEASLIVVRGNGKREVRLANMRARLVALTVIGEDGVRVFDETDVKRLGEKSAAALDRVFDAARKLSKMSEKDVEELAEGFVTAPNGASTSDLQDTSE